MDALRLLAQKKKEEAKAVAGDNNELEEARLKRLRKEEEQERLEKEKRRKTHAAASSSNGGATNTAGGPNDGSAAPGDASGRGFVRADSREVAEATRRAAYAGLKREEVIRRLRALAQPATLFGEEDSDRLQRLIKAEQDLQVEDEAVGGFYNALLELQRQEAKKAKKGGASSAGKQDGDKHAHGQHASGSGKDGAGKDASGDGKSAGGDGVDGANGEVSDPTLAAFQKAAAALAEKRAEDALPVEERIAKSIKGWMAEWEADLEARSDDVKQSGSGVQASLKFKETQRNLAPLYERLHKKALDGEMRTGIWMMVQAMKERNYLHANDVYLKLAIGTSAWPIGVTQVGIHFRAAREKISHVGNVSGHAHIMNDEATRKYLQAIKRLLGTVQRLHPTDPSRSVDFNAFAHDPGRGAAGGGSDKLALLAAEAAGENAAALGLPAAPHYMAPDGSVRIPAKWKSVMAQQEKALYKAEGGTGGS